MSYSMRQIYIHLIWHTENRRPSIRGDLERFVHRRIREIAEDLGLHPLAVNSAWTHTHSLITWNTTTSFAQAIRELKSRPSVEWNQRHDGEASAPELAWQRGYSIWSVRKEDVGTIVDYISNQKTIHRENRPIERLER